MVRKLFFAKVNDTARMRHYRVPGLVGSIVAVLKAGGDVVLLPAYVEDVHFHATNCGGFVGSDYTLLHD